MKTNYQGPIEVEEVKVGPVVIRQVRPADPDQLLDDPWVEAWNRRDGYMPYWAYAWPSALVLAEECLRRETILAAADTEVLEIGCGLGLPGLVSLKLGARVVFSDVDAESFRFVARSIAENGLDATRAEFLTLDWRQPPPRPFPFILGSDLLYEPALCCVLARFLQLALAPAGQALIATPPRTAAEGFPAVVKSHGLLCRIHEDASNAASPTSSNGCFIYEITRPPKSDAQKALDGTIPFGNGTRHLPSPSGPSLKLHKSHTESSPGHNEI